MEEQTEIVRLRCKPLFKRGVEILAKKEGIKPSELIRRSVREHNDNIWGTLKMLKKLVPIKVVVSAPHPSKPKDWLDEIGDRMYPEEE